MAQTVSVIVTAEERARLAAIVGDQSRPLKHVQRALIVLHSADRLPVLDVARRVSITRPADAMGEPAYNLKLSERRAESVRKWLIEREGLGNLRFTIQGFGASRPKGPNTKPDGSDDPDGRQLNRRVELVFNTG